MHRKIVRIGSWCFAMAVFMCCVSISVNAQTTNPIWYVRSAKDFLGSSEDLVTIGNSKYYIIAPSGSGSLSDMKATLTESASYSNYTSYENPEVLPLTGYRIYSAWEPYSLYNFKIDSNWRIIKDPVPSESSDPAFFGFADRNKLVYITTENEIYRDISNNPTNSYQSRTTYSTSASTYIPFLQTNDLTIFNQAWSNPMFATVGKNTFAFPGESININDIMVFICKPNDEVMASAKFYLLCPTYYMPSGVTFGDIFPVGNPFKKVETPEEIAVNKFSGDKDAIESVGQTLETGINSITDFTTQGIGEESTTNIEFISTLFNDVFPWWFDIFGLMFLFGVLGIVVRRALHD